MKSNDREAKRNLSVAELEGELRAALEKRFKLKFKHQTAPLANPVELRTLRRDVARLKTWIQAKQESK